MYFTLPYLMYLLFFMKFRINSYIKSLFIDSIWFFFNFFTKLSNIFFIIIHHILLTYPPSIQPHNFSFLILYETYVNQLQLHLFSIKSYS